MKTLLVVVLLSSATVVAACHGRKPSTTAPSTSKGSPEHDTDATGGATYGGDKGDRAGKDTPNRAAH